MITRYVEERHEFGKAEVGKPAPGVMQVFEEDGVPLMVDFLCPCGCGSTCPTPLVTKARPRTDANRPIWDFSPGPTLRPSIRFTGGCRAHFTITDGSVEFHGDSGK